MTDYDFTKIVRQVALQENIKDCKLEYKYSTNKGDGYLGTVKAVQLTGSNKKLDVVMKYSHRNAKVHENLPLRDAYLNEIKFYEVIAPAFAKFQDDNKLINPFDNTAKFYGCVTEPFDELLVLENLKAQNYDLWNRKELMNKEHIEYAVKTFGKFHGTSFAMKQLKPKIYNEIIKGMENNDLYKTLIEQMGFYKQVKQIITDDLLCIFDPVTEKSQWDKLNEIAEHSEEEMNKAFNYHEDDIILQGDCWCNNMMYQYEDMNDRTKPKNMKFVNYILQSMK